ncbi:hypothetical protein HYC85_027515 [Camellia sinensis]|uniref:Carbohydrate kinase FGGY N-terminal domain-containing protein n=1 Tax=Camellia sinensis TaxID=4442 RepID=A0A7J7GAN0_CAMSI|nr:hypothetical protein HYC85_027515 [Camellia sinensis]
MEIRESVRICKSKAIDKATVDGYKVDGGLKAIGLINQRETTVVWSKSTAFHLYNAIVWMDVCTSSICRFSFFKTEMSVLLSIMNGTSTSSVFVGWVEHDPMEIWESVRICMSKAIDKATVDGYNVDGGLKAIGLTNQRGGLSTFCKRISLKTLYDKYFIKYILDVNHFCKTSY